MIDCFTSDYLALLDGQKETSHGIQCLCAFSLHLGKKQQ